MKDMTPGEVLHDKDPTVVMIQNIPSELHSASLRGFFSDFVESGRCLLFHYQHRRDPEAAGKEGEENGKRCCLARLASQADVRAFIDKYNGRRWIQLSHTGDDVELPEKCAVRAARDRDFGNHSFNATATENGDGDTIYMTKSQRRAKARQNSNKILGFLPELCPPQGLPQGNVGTPTKTLRELVSACKVPQSALKGLGLNLSSALRRRRHGEFSFNWQLHDSGEVDEEDGAEEWERHEAQHGEVPTHGWERADRLECDFPLFEEECEQTWEKGSSGLVFYTDEARWDADHGDFHERTRDGLDVEPGAEEVECDWETEAPVVRDEEEEQKPRRVSWQDGGERRGEGVGRSAGRGVVHPMRVERRGAVRGAAAAGRGRGRGEGGRLDALLGGRREPAEVSGAGRPGLDLRSLPLSLRACAVPCPELTCVTPLPGEGDRGEWGLGGLESTERKEGERKKSAGKGVEVFERDVKRGVAGSMMRGMGWTEGAALGRRGGGGLAEGLEKEWERACVKEGEGRKAVTRKGIGFKSSGRQAEEEDGAGEEGGGGGGADRGGPGRLGGKRRREERAEGEGYTIGSSMDGVAHSEGGAARGGRAAMLGEFAMEEMRGEEEEEGQGDGEEGGVRSGVVEEEGGARRTLRRKQLEEGRFRRGGVLSQGAKSQSQSQREQEQVQGGAGGEERRFVLVGALPQQRSA